MKEHLKQYAWKKGESGNPKGRPEGVVSVRQKLQERFRKNPASFKEFLDRYVNNPANEKHVAEMLDGKPEQSVKQDIKVELPIPILPIHELRDDNRNQEAIEAPEED